MTGRHTRPRPLRGIAYLATALCSAFDVAIAIIHPDALSIISAASVALLVMLWLWAGSIHPTVFLRGRKLIRQTRGDLHGTPRLIRAGWRALDRRLK